MAWETVRRALVASGQFAIRHPTTVWTVVRHAAGLRISVPLAWLRRLSTQMQGPHSKFWDLHVEAQAPGLHVATTVRVMGMDLRLDVIVEVRQLLVDRRACCVTLRLRQLQVQVLGGKESALSALLRSGALDLSRPGEVLRFLPRLPAGVVHAEGEEIELNLMQIEALRRDERFRNAIRLFAGAFIVRDVRCEGDFFSVQLYPRPRVVGRVLALCRQWRW